MRRILALVPLGESAQPDPFAAVAAAAAIAAESGGAATALLLGREEDAVAVAQAAREGAAEILHAVHPGLGAPPQVEHLLACFAAPLGGSEGLHLLPAGPVGEELAARLAIPLDAVPLGRCAAIRCESGEVIAHRLSHGGRAEAVLASAAPRCLAAVRRPATAPAAVADPVVRRLVLDTVLPAEVPPPEEQPASGEVLQRLEGARLVVAGGRGMGGPEGFAQLQQLAKLLGAACGASLPAVDAGWARVAQQVGQSGAFVSPAAYLAVGMSGTAQHLAGIGLNTRILAVNPDPDAEIFRVAELGMVASWQDVLPLLIGRLQASADPGAPLATEVDG